jgi:hypothetical protein
MGNVTRDGRTHLVKDVEISISECVMKQHPILLRPGSWLTNNMDDWNIFRVCACDGVQSREFSNTKGGN